MRTAYFDCFSGVSGDMTLGALIACGAPVDRLREGLEGLGVGGWRLDLADVSRNGIGATDVTVAMTEEKGHGRHLSDIRRILDNSRIPEHVRERAMAVFTRLAEAEATVHQTTPDRIHFHEVGAVDAIVDIVGSCLALDLLGVERVVCAPLPMGHGFVECMHGTIPLPAPAVLEILKGVPVRHVDVEGELVTPTGAALMAVLAAEFGALPSMQPAATGYGAGKKQFGERPNLLRVIIGEEERHDRIGTGSLDEVAVIETNLDDMSPQFFEVLTERLFAAGALDVYTAPIQMKKSRPATLLTVLIAPERTEAAAEILFRETTTLGVRYQTMKRLCQAREWVTVTTEFGDVRVKVGRWKGEETTAAPEYVDVKALAEKHAVPVRRVHQSALEAYARRGR